VQKTSPTTHAFDRLLRTAWELDQQLGRLLRPPEVTPAQFSVLRLLAGEEDGLACSELTEGLAQHDPDVTRLLDRLEARGYVSRARDPDDRRVVKARITRAGRAVLSKLSEDVEALHAQQFAPLSRDEVRTLISLLDRVLAGTR
jgi:DNA-binding MarR family transcriptional regulator